MTYLQMVWGYRQNSLLEEMMDNLLLEVMDQLELEARMVENPLWEMRDFDDLGVFFGPKDIADSIEELLEEI